jgi:glycosyltransferase involved in cell wall biosynthesis
VSFAKGYRRVLPLFRAVRDERETRILHLHWTGPYVKGSRRIAFAAYLAKFIVDLAAVRLSGRRIVWTLHNLIPHEARFPRLETAARKMICKMASVVIVHGRAGREEVGRRFGCRPDKIVVIPHGHYRSAYGAPNPRGAAREQLKIDPSTRMFLFIGFLRPYKGIELLLRAWRRLEARDAVLVIAGEAPDPAYAANLARLAGDCPSIRLQNRFVSEGEIPTMLSAADVVVLPFERVQTSGSVVLAMSFGRPIVTSRLGELPEMLAGADDLLFTAGNEDDLLRQLDQAATVELGDLAARTEAACDRLDWDGIGAATVDVYRRAVGSG